MNPASMPSVAIPRSRWPQPFNHSFSALHGKLIPIDCFEVLPGDDYSVKKSVLEVIMSTPIVPAFMNIRCRVTAFYVPTRLLWEHTEEFYGANKTSAGPQLNTYVIPNRSIFRGNIPAGSVSHYLGKPIVSGDINKYAYGRVSVLKERAYWFIWSEWYRAQQLQNPFLLNKQDGAPGDAAIGTLNGSNISFSSMPATVCKQIDMFTAATITPQYGAAVELPLGSYAPLIVGDTVNDLGGNLILTDDQTSHSNVLLGTYGASGEVFNSTNAASIGTGDDMMINKTNLVADLSKATAAKINDIRYAFQLQKYLERANYGSRFFEVLAVHYGVTSPDSRLQRPEYLGGKTAPIVIKTVMSTAGYTAGVSQEVGKLGAASITAIDLSGLFSKGFVEPGYVFIMMSTTHERTYSGGLLREDMKLDRFEFYSPEFANLGDQAIKNSELLVTGDSSDNSNFGYQGHWDEYRFRRNRVSGLLDPKASNNLSYWSLAETFDSRPYLSASFIEENRDAISKVLVSGANGPDYLCDFFVQYAATREMPIVNIPGLIDHFGAL